MTTLSYTTKEISFDTIKHVWFTYLWPNRLDIQETNSMQYLGGYDKNISKKYKPYFFGLYYNDELVGVNSCHRTSDTHIRSRGIFINKEHREKKLSFLLFQEVEKIGIFEKCSYIWSLPRISALPAYESFGFEITSEVITDDRVKYGPNIYVLKKIKDEKNA
jgi:hypothetical protein